MTDTANITFVVSDMKARAFTMSVERSSVVKKTVCERCMNAKQAFALNGQIKRTWLSSKLLNVFTV